MDKTEILEIIKAFQASQAARVLRALLDGQVTMMTALRVIPGMPEDVSAALLIMIESHRDLAKKVAIGVGNK